MRYPSAFVMMLATTAFVAQSAIASGKGAETDPFADNACVQCHRDLPGRSSELVELEWKQSVHHAARVGCDGCHGGNASARRDQFASDEQFKRAAHLERNSEFLLVYRGPEFVGAARGRAVSYLCGKCHAKIKQQHLGSPHGEFGDPTCLYCHGGGSHRITRASLDIIDTRGRAEGGRCSPCHVSATMQSVGRIKQLLKDTEAQIETSGDQYKQLEAWGYRNLELEKLHHHAAGVRSEIRQVFHSFNMKEITEHTADIQSVADRTGTSFELVQRLRRTQRQQTGVGSMAVLLLLGFAGLLVYYKNTFLMHGRPAIRPGASPAPATHIRGTSTTRPEATPMVNAQPSPATARGSWVRLGAALMLVHIYVTWGCLAIGALASGGDVGGAASRFWSLGHVLYWPVFPVARSLIDVGNSAVFWPLYLGNSALWGFGLAGIVYLIRMCSAVRRSG